MSPNNIHQPPPTIEPPKSLNPNYLNCIFTFMVTFLLSLLQLKSQGEDTISPFSTNPFTILLSTLWLLLYCCAFATCLKSSSSSSSAPPPPLPSLTTSSPPPPPTIHLPSSPQTTKYSPKEMMIICGMLALASLGSLLFPSSAQLYSLYTMYVSIGLYVVFHWARLRHRISQAPRGNILPLHIREIIQP
ncbi:hypothetical protein SOVF_150140 [Spinacia oleracea]|nr:hypothetical protein SOVF_150140 [Spinacia oleracea]